jgi:hypothetical protein
LPIIEVIRMPGRSNENGPLTEAFTSKTDGVMINSGQFDGTPVSESIDKVITWLDENELGKAAVNYRLRDVTATRDEDYFAPGSNTIEFAPGQRTARLLIPLVQDVAFEDNEAFRVELIRGDPDAGGEVYSHTAVIIRDDDS